MRGFWYTVEAILAGVILVFFLGFISHTTLQTAQPGDLSTTAYRLLHDLDARGLLRSAAVNYDHASLNNSISLPGFNHTVQVCDFNNQCNGTAPSAKNVWTAAYFIAGDSIVPGTGVYKPFEVRLYLWQ